MCEKISERIENLEKEFYITKIKNSHTRRIKKNVFIIAPVVVVGIYLILGLVSFILTGNWISDMINIPTSILSSISAGLIAVEIGFFISWRKAEKTAENKTIEELEKRYKELYGLS